VGPCHHGVAHPPVVVGEDGLQIWRIAANILNKKSWTTAKWWSCSTGLCVSLTTLHCINPACYKILYRASALDFGLRTEASGELLQTR
jgi:hypothetical protein